MKNEEQIVKIVKEGFARTEEILDSIEARRGLRWAKMAKFGAQSVHSMGQLAAIVQMVSPEPALNSAVDVMLRSIMGNMVMTQAMVASGKLDGELSEEIQKAFIADIDMILQALKAFSTKLAKAT